MTYQIGDLVLCKVTNPGQGTIILPSAAETGRVHPSFWLANGDTTSMYLRATDGSAWEMVSVATYSSTGNGQLARTTVAYTSAGKASTTKINFTGEVYVYLQIPRHKRVLLDPNGSLIDGAGNLLQALYADTGSADDIQIAAPWVASYAHGMSFAVDVANANASTTPTLTVGALAAKDIVRADGTTAVAASEVAVGLQRFTYDAGNDVFRIDPRPAGQAVAVIADSKAQNTSGGTFTSGADRTRDLNTEVSDPSEIVSISANQFTLAQPGSYLIEWSAPGRGVDQHQSWLYDITGAAVLQRGSSEIGSSGGLIQSRSEGAFLHTIAASNSYEIRHRGTSTRATDGFGLAANFGAETYTWVKIRKVA